MFVMFWMNDALILESVFHNNNNLINICLCIAHLFDFDTFASGKLETDVPNRVKYNFIVHKGVQLLLPHLAVH